MPAPIRTARDLGLALRRARRAAGLTQRQLGDRIGLRQATVSTLENGEGATLETVFAVLTALKLELLAVERSSASVEDIF